MFVQDYLKELKSFRNQITGHRDKDEKINFPNDWIELQEKINKLIPIDKIIKDVNAYYQEVMNKH